MNQSQMCIHQTEVTIWEAKSERRNTQTIIVGGFNTAVSKVDNQLDR